MFKVISVLVVISQFFSTNVFGSPVKDGNDSHYLEVEIERLKTFVEDLSKTFNTSVEPCEEFISYVNGNGEDTTDHTKIQFQYILKSMFVNYFEGNNNLTPCEIKAKTFFDLCLDKITKNDFFDTVKSLNSDNVGHFPTGVTDWKNDKFELSATLATFNRIGFGTVLSFRVDMKDEKREFYLKAISSRHSSLYDEPEDFVKVFEYFGFTNDEISNIKTDFAELEEHSRAVNTSEEYQLVTLGWLKVNIPEFDWVRYFDIVGCGIIKETDEIHVKEDGIKNIIELLSKTDKKKVANYVFYNIYRDLYSADHNMHSGDKDDCYDAIFWYFPDVYVNIALKEYLDDHDKLNYINVTKSVLNALKDEKTDKSIARKHDQFIKIIADPSGFEHNFEDSYKNIEVSSSNLFVSALHYAYDISMLRGLNPDVFYLNKYIIKNLNVNHKKPRILMAHYFVKKLNNINPPFEVDGNKCIDLVTLQKKFKNALKTLEYLKESNEEIFENEKQYLEKYELSQNKVLLNLLTESFIASDNDFITTKKPELENLIFSLDEFFTEYKCPNEKFFKLDEKVIGEDHCVA